MSRPLDALTFALHGSHLIEASAGTGKTYTLAALYLRLVLGHGDDSGFGRPLLPPDILVVTFTEAATRELRDRIRQRLAGAARFFAGADEGSVHADEFLRELRNSVPEAERHQQAARLRAAAQWMDDAAIFTIHGFCQRMLRQHAFDSGSLFTLELTPDEELLLATACNDYWRTFCLSLDNQGARCLAQEFASPDALLKDIRPLLNARNALPESDATPADIITLWGQQHSSMLSEMKTRWQDWATSLRQLLDELWASGELKKGSKPRRQDVISWLDAVMDWCKDPQLDRSPFDSKAKVFERMTRQTLEQSGVTNDAVLSHPALGQFDQLAAPDKFLPKLAPRLLPHACHWIAERLSRSKHQQALIGFDDMLGHLFNALNGPQGDALAAQIRRQYPFALIDEFQDTDPVQYGIFHKVYADQDDTGWLMIGDPKQAIYSFRGADIHTYLSARNDTAGRHHTLGTNYRSAAPLVDAINSIFQRAQQQPGGAFLLGDDVPFLPVDARGRNETFEVDSAPSAPLTFWHLRRDAADSDQSYSRKAYLQAMAGACAAHIARLVHKGQQGQAGFRNADSFTALHPADIAILVRDRKEADSIRRALQALGLPSVYLSDRDNVFAGNEAQDVMAWLQACAEPDNERRVRLALATSTLDQDWQSLHALVSDEALWEDTAERFTGYARLWQERGALAMIRQLLRDFSVASRILAKPDGERLLTNVLHIGELLQQAASQLDGEQALVRWLGEMIDASTASNGSVTADEQVLRLESDAALIKVITMHKSKGLEYPLVFIPFACTFRPASADRPPLRYHDSNGRLVVSLSPDNHEASLADSERLAEDLRLMYVAMTRARHACWLGIAATRNGNHKSLCELHRSAIGNLLGASADTSASDIDALLETLAHSGIQVADAPDDQAALATPEPPPRTLAPARTFSGPHSESWWIASYSALRKADNEDAPDSVRDDIFREERAPDDSSPAAAYNAHAFPRGPLPGTFLHELLEWGAEQGFARCHAADADWQQVLATRCESRGWQDWQPTLQGWLQQVTHTSLPVTDAPLALAALAPSQYRAEIEFWLPANHVDVSALDALVCQHTLDGAERPALLAPQLNGMLKGFIDLVVEHQGRYYVLDYKSNWLGDGDGNYHSAALRQAINHGRYDMQYSLYLLALHRLLRARLGDDYDYDTHVGGSLYLFLRGIADDGAGLFQERPSRALIEGMDALFREGPH